MSAPWLEAKPNVPSQWDDEFESLSLDPKWTRVGTAVTAIAATSLDPFNTAFGGGTQSIESIHSARRSWLMGQSSTTIGFDNGYEQDLSGLPTDCFLWWRASANGRRASMADNDSETFVMLYNTATGFAQNRAVIIFDSFTSIRQGLFNRAINGGATVNLGLLRNYLGEGYPLEYMGIQQLGLTYHGWMAPESGNWVWMGSATFTVPLDRMIIGFNNASVAAPGRSIGGFDFFRVLLGRGPP